MARPLRHERAATSPNGNRRLPLTAILFLLLTATISLLWSHHKLLSQDEFFVLQTDSVSTVAQLIHIQRTTPISLDPLVYHLLAHAATSIFGAGAFALRLPSLLGYLLMQICLFFIVRRMANQRAAIFALAFPALTATLFYSAEGRPYGLLLGLYALTLLSWQSVTRKTSQRLPSLVILSISIALTLNAHYFGILLLIPLCAAELFRTLERRRLDIPVIAAIILGMAAIAFALPFQKAAAEFRQHYYNGGAVSLHAITQSYRSLFIDYTHLSLLTQHFIAIAFVICAAALTLACIYRLKSPALQLPRAEIVFILTLAALPFFGFLLARFVTHSIEVRYVLGAIIAITILLAIALAPIFRRDTPYRIALAFLFLATITGGLIRIHAEEHATQEILTSLIPSLELKAAILASPTQLLYIQDMGHFQVASYYQPDAFIRAHTALLYSRDNEILWDQHDTVSLTAMHMRFFTGFPIVTYEQLKQQPGPHILVLFHTGWDWTDQALAADHAQITPLGPAFSGDAVSIRFPRQTQIASK